MKRLPLLLTLLAFALPLAADEVARLHALFDKTWETRIRESPMFATSVGRHEYDDKLGSMTPADLQRRHAQAKAALAELSAIDRAALPPNELVNADIFRRQLESAIESYELGDYQMPFNADSGFHTGFSRLAEEVPLKTVKDYENYISRLRAWPRLVREEIALMRMGIARGFTVPRATLDGYERTMSAHVVDDPAQSVFWKPFEKFSLTIPEADRERLRNEARAAVMEGGIGRGWTATCRRCSSPCRGCRTPSRGCPPTSPRSTRAAATSVRRSAARSRGSTGSTRTCSTAGRCTTWRR